MVEWLLRVTRQKMYKNNYGVTQHVCTLDKTFLVTWILVHSGLCVWVFFIWIELFRDPYQSSFAYIHNIYLIVEGPRGLLPEFYIQTTSERSFMQQNLYNTNSTTMTCSKSGFVMSV